MAQGIKRLGMPIAALFGLALVGLVGTSWFLNRDALQRAVEAQIRAVTGLELVVNGPIDVSVFPGSYVSFHNVGLKGADTIGPALQVDVLTANLRLLPLLLRRFEIADVMMLRPHIHVVRDGAGESNWTPFVETIAKAMTPGAENQVSFSEIRIQDGELNYQDGTNNISEQLGDIDLSLAWPSISRSFAATGQFDWRGERVDGSISASDFVALLSGDRSGLKARLASAPLKVAFDGTVANRTSLMMEGVATMDSPSLRNALRWMGQAPPGGGGGFGRFALKARANVVGGSVALTNVNVELDGNVAEGVMTYANNGRQTLQATLAAGNLDFTPYISTFRLLASGQRDWNRQLFDLSSLSSTDLDMRLSAAKVTVGPSKLGRTAFGANLRGGALALSVGEAQMYGGIAKGSFAIARSDAVADVRAQFQFTDVDLQACASELFGINKLSGRGNLNVSLTASGSSPFGLASSLDGTATLNGHDGAIAGFNVEQLLKRLEKRPLSGGGNFRSGSTPYDNLSISVKFADGVATADDIHVESPTAKITLTGTASVPSREYDLKGVASLTSASAGGNGFDLPFVIQGPWDDPLIFPDPESLIRRSPASAPLLDAVKDRKTRDAVRSVIERFTGGGAARPAAAPDAAAGAPGGAPAASAENAKSN
ncbi:MULTISPECIES: AsmA family protein [Bradyrhizobium]|uniref:AsmA family protein n=1 Tax=Bradyrhizobium brasilense TaxID=1419277 RepID=A0ABY8JN94_9BRAD|nr:MULTISPECIES: AsmA family protein [Bradyrhizobium]MCP1841587.1 AsmA protein [Bradyrhizobium sp. USDA 4538]MCP1902151.1 AsmA protein [Bradyrhizobium sp. USDA 4537]MCP1992192.1 AsmA protein [Bradyrhizobium sp. USDA 4539]MCP3418482.1 AsmA family protein [Bradyrhizobium brasilense]OMI06287.1 cell envelope biogenesis protein AsmA [Bradyrhizobium brasilense]